jgi:hypothetical protein
VPTRGAATGVSGVAPVVVDTSASFEAEDPAAGNGATTGPTDGDAAEAGAGLAADGAAAREVTAPALATRWTGADPAR